MDLLRALAWLIESLPQWLVAIKLALWFAPALASMLSLMGLAVALFMIHHGMMPSDRPRG